MPTPLWLSSIFVVCLSNLFALVQQVSWLTVAYASSACHLQHRQALCGLWNWFAPMAHIQQLWTTVTLQGNCSTGLVQAVVLTPLLCLMLTTFGRRMQTQEGCEQLTPDVGQDRMLHHIARITSHIKTAAGLEEQPLAQEAVTIQLAALRSLAADPDPPPATVLSTTNTQETSLPHKDSQRRATSHVDLQQHARSPLVDTARDADRRMTDILLGKTHPVAFCLALQFTKSVKLSPAWFPDIFELNRSFLGPELDKQLKQCPAAGT